MLYSYHFHIRNILPDWWDCCWSAVAYSMKSSNMLVRCRPKFELKKCSSCRKVWASLHSSTGSFPCWIKPLPQSPTVKGRSSGVHYYFKYFTVLIHEKCSHSNTYMSKKTRRIKRNGTEGIFNRTRKRATQPSRNPLHAPAFTINKIVIFL